MADPTAGGVTDDDDGSSSGGGGGGGAGGEKAALLTSQDVKALAAKFEAMGEMEKVGSANATGWVVFGC